MPDLSALASYTLAMSLTPGPNNLMLLDSGSRFGLRRTLPHMLGVVLGFGLQTLLVCAGVGVVFLRHPWLKSALAVLGALYLVYLALRLVRQGALAGEAVARPWRIGEAIAFQAVNPKAWMTAVSIATVFMPAGGMPWRPAIEIFLVLCVTNSAAVGVWAGCGDLLQAWLARRAIRLAFNGGLALLLLVTAVYTLRGSHSWA